VDVAKQTTDKQRHQGMSFFNRFWLQWGPGVVTGA